LDKANKWKIIWIFTRCRFTSEWKRRPS